MDCFFGWFTLLNAVTVWVVLGPVVMLILPMPKTTRHSLSQIALGGPVIWIMMFFIVREVIRDREREGGCAD
jgi:hypothetical protein